MVVTHTSIIYVYTSGSKHPVYCLVLDGCALEAQIDLARDTTNKKV